MELTKVKDLFIFPNMGDGGLSVGAAVLEYFNKTNKRPKKLRNYYLGLKYSEAEIIKEIKKNNLNFKKFKKFTL